MFLLLLIGGVLYSKRVHQDYKTFLWWDKLKKSKKCSLSGDGKMPQVLLFYRGSRNTLLIVVCIPRAEWCEGLDLPEWKCVNWNAVFEASSDYCYWIVKLSSRTHQQKLKLSEDILCEKDLEVIHFVKSIQDWMHRCIELTSFTYYPRLLSLTSLNLSTLKKCFLKTSFHQFVQWIESKSGWDPWIEKFFSILHP